MMLFAIVFGLSMDYEVFLLSRIREEYDRTGDNAVAVADGLASTARVITAAAAIMVCVFGELRPRRRTRAQALRPRPRHRRLVDATIVRLVLVPATMELLGDRNWWLPGWLDRILPRLTSRRRRAERCRPERRPRPRRGRATRHVRPAGSRRWQRPPRANQQIGAAMTTSPALDHIALTVPNLDDHVERLTTAFGMVAQFRSEHFAVVVDPGSDFKLELSTSDDGEVHLRHLGFRSRRCRRGAREPCRRGHGDQLRHRIDRTSQGCTRRSSSSPAAWKSNS